MSERFDLTHLRSQKRAKERVDLEAGPVWVWAMTVAETVQLAERAVRPKFDPRGGVDPTESLLWQIALSCYYGEEDGSERIFTENNLMDLYRLPLAEFKLLALAVQRVNGQNATEAEVMKDFFAAKEAAASSL